MEKKEVLSEFGKKLAEFRKSRGVTQVELSRRSGIPPSNISKIEKGVLNCALYNLSRLIRALDGRIAIDKGKDDNK